MKTLFNTCLPVLCLSLFLWNCNSPTHEENNSEDSIVVNMEDAEAMSTVAEPEDYILQTMMNSMMYASLAQVASERASAQEVKDFANTLFDSTEVIVAKLQELFDAVEGEAPQAMSVAQQAQLDSLQNLPPAEFDQAFVNYVVQAQEDDIEILQSLATEADNVIVIGLAEEIENMMQAQLEKARTVREETM